MSTSESWGVHTTQCTSLWSDSVSWCLAEGHGNGDQRRHISLVAQEGLDLNVSETHIYNIWVLFDWQFFLRVTPD